MATEREQTENQEEDRGRESTRPRAIPKRGWRDILLRTKNAISKDNVDLIAGGVAFYGLLSIFPALAALISIYGLIADPAQVQEQIQAAAEVMPEDAQGIISQQMTDITGASPGALGVTAILTVLFALWSASRGTKAFMAAMNIAYNEDEKRGFIKFNLTGLVLTLFIIVLVMLAVAGIVAVPIVFGFLGLEGFASWLITLLRWPLIALIFIAALAVFYRFAPSRQGAQWKWITPGSVAAVILWLIASAGFSIYIQNFGNLNETYGSLGAIVALMLWLWLSAFIVILGAELNSEMERQTKRDTTTGKPRRLGKRGAYAADTVGDSP